MAKKRRGRMTLAERRRHEASLLGWETRRRRALRPPPEPTTPELEHPIAFARRELSFTFGDLITGGLPAEPGDEAAFVASVRDTVARLSSYDTALDVRTSWRAGEGSTPHVLNFTRHLVAPWTIEDVAQAVHRIARKTMEIAYPNVSDTKGIVLHLLGLTFRVKRVTVEEAEAERAIATRTPEERELSNQLLADFEETIEREERRERRARSQRAKRANRQRELAAQMRADLEAILLAESKRKARPKPRGKK